MTAPSARVWMATFVALIFSIGLLTGIVVERVVLGPQGPQGARVGPSGPTGPSGPAGPQGRGRRGGGPGGPGGPMFGPPPAQYVEDLDREVQLTDAQRTQVLSLLQAQEDRMRQLQDDARRQFIAEQDGLHDRIAAVLSPEQAEAFRAWAARRVGGRR